MEEPENPLAQWLASIQPGFSTKDAWASQDKFLSLLVETMNDGLLVENQQGDIVYANRRLCEMTGYSCQELAGQKSTLLIEPNDIPIYLEKTASRESIKSETYELRCRTKQEKRFFVTASVQALFDTQNQYAGNIAVLTDTTGMKEKQESLEKSEKMARLLINATMVGFFLCDLKGTILDVNENMASRFNKTRDQLLETCVWDLFGDEVTARRMAKGLEAMKTRKSVRFVEEVSGIWTDSVVVPVYDAQGIIERLAIFSQDITQQKNAELQLRESESRYRIFADTTNEAIIFHDNGILLDANLRFFELFGYQHNELIGKDVISILITPHTAQQLRKQFHLQNFYTINGEGFKKDGATFPFESCGSCLTYQGKKVQALAIRDITLFKENERKLKESEEKYRAMMETAREAITILDYDGRYHFMNQIGADRLETSPEEVVGKNMRQFFPRKIADLQIQLLRKCLDSGIGTTFETQTFIHGQPCWYETTIEPIRNDDETPNQALVIARDISDKKLMIDQLRVSEEKYRCLVENADDVIVIYDRKGHLLFINKIGAQILGYQQTTIVGKTLWELLPKKTADEIFEQIQETLRTSKLTKKILQMPVKEKARWKAFTFSPLQDTEGQAYAVQIISKDITEMKDMEEKLTLYRSKMAITERLAQVGIISSSMAHELSQPLTVIRLHMDDILENLKKKGVVEFQTQFHTLFKEINKTSAITQRYLKLSRPAGSEETKQWNIYATLDLLRDALQTAANSTGFEILLNKTLRQIPSYSYSGDLEQIFFILMQNAIQAAQEKKKKTLRIWASRRKEFLVLQFKDNCGGIPKKYLEKIFEPFYSTKSRDQGTGLGLTIVRQILEEHGGKIQVQSQYRKGTVFSLWLPYPLAKGDRKKKMPQK